MICFISVCALAALYRCLRKSNTRFFKLQQFIKRAFYFPIPSSTPASYLHVFITYAVTPARYSAHTVSSSPELSESRLWGAALAHFRLCVLVLAAGFSWALNLIVFELFGINWTLIFGEEIEGTVEFSAASIARVCAAAALWLWLCCAFFVQNLSEYSTYSLAGDDAAGGESAYAWAKLSSASIVGLPLLLMLLPLPVLAWRTRFAWLTLLLKMLIVPFVEVYQLIL